MNYGEIIRYVGGPNHITILGKELETGKLFVLYCNTRQLDIQINGTLTNDGPCEIDAKIEIPINDCFYVLCKHYIDDIKEFDLINDIVESFLEVKHE